MEQCRIKLKIAIQFNQWATKCLKLKYNYFSELKMNINFLKLIEDSIPKDTTLKNLSVARKVRIPVYQYTGILENKCELYNPLKKEYHYASESDFQFLFSHWKEYLNGDLVRSQLVHKPFNNTATTYTICVMKFLQDNNLLD